MMTSWKYGVAGLVLSLAAACGNDPNQPDIISGVRGAFSALITPRLGAESQGPTVVQIRKSVTPEFRAANLNRPVLIVELEKSSQAALLVGVAVNDRVITYLTLDDVSLAIADGVLIATRGLGFDLMAADVSDFERALVSGGGPTKRVHRYLDGEGKLFNRTFACDVAIEGRTITETCEGEGQAFTNTYATNAIDWIISSRQWIGPEHGYIRIEDLGIE